jgi:HNH endonuclease
LSAISTYAPVGHCIYCGSDGGEQGLGDEHIVPFSLGGVLVLPKASCRACEAITSAFERRCAHIMYGSFRIRENQTRRPKERPTKLPMCATFGDKGEVYMMPVDGVVATLPLVHFLPPGYLREPQVMEIGWPGATLEVKTNAPKNKSLWGRSNASTFSVSQKFDLDSLARTLAKTSLRPRCPARSRRKTQPQRAKLQGGVSCGAFP